MRTLLLLFVTVIIGGCASNAVMSDNERWSRDRLNILVVGEELGEGYVPKNNRVYKRVANALISEISKGGYAVRNESSVNSNFNKNRYVRLSESEISDMARSVDYPPIDVVAVYSVAVNKNNSARNQKLFTRVMVRLIDAQSGQKIGHYEMESPTGLNISDDCGYECQLEVIGKNTRYLAMDLGAQLVEEINSYVFSKKRNYNNSHHVNKTEFTTPYVLVFKGLSSNKLNYLEEYLVSGIGNRHLRLMSSSMRKTEYWYETSGSVNEINQLLHDYTNKIGVDARVSMTGNKYLIQKIN